MKTTFELQFSILADPIAQQLKAQGLTVSGKLAERWERSRESINWLYLHDLITPKERGNADSRLLKQIAKRGATEVEFL